MIKWIYALVLCGAVLTTPVWGQVYTVNSSNDTDDGRCNSAHCSLREAISEANNAGGANIAFDIQPAGRHVIRLQSALPAIGGEVSIDGYTQPGAIPASSSNQAAIMISINGSGIAGNADGLVIARNEVTISGLNIANFSGSGIRVLSNNNMISGNYIGTDLAGEDDFGNAQHGILLSNANANTIGGSSHADRNVISGNDLSGITMAASDSNAVLGNYIGVNAAGDEALRNSREGVNVSQSSRENIIGGNRSSGAGNVISGNGTAGIFIDSAAQTQILGNFIGVDLTGSVAIGNGNDGISVESADTLTIGQNANQGTGNVISGNDRDGIDVTNTTGLKISGNRIGTDVTGTIAIGNAFSGIQLLTDVPAALIGGDSSPEEGNIISNNGSHGIFSLSFSFDLGLHEIYGNKVGTDVSGTVAMGNGIDGIHLGGHRVHVGGRTTTNKPNIIAANGSFGLHIQGTGNCVVRGNAIGTDVTGSVNLGNGDDGIKIEASDNRIGGTNRRAGNLIAFNRGDGVRVDGTRFNRIMSNSFFQNQDAGIELEPVGITSNDNLDTDTGSNDLQNFPVIQTVTNLGSGTVSVQGRLRSQPDRDYRIEFFVGRGLLTPIPLPPVHNKGGNFVRAINVTTNGSGEATFTAQVSGEFTQFVTATATDLTDLNTSEFSSRHSIPRVSP